MMGQEDEDPYGGDWGDLGGWPEPELPPDEEEAPAGPEPGEVPPDEGPPPGWPAQEDAES